MRLVSPLLKHVIYPALHHTGLLDGVPPVSNCTVVNYHGLLPPDHDASDVFLDGNLLQPEVFRQQIRFLKAHYQIIHPEEFRTWIEQGKPLPARAVLLTCDDGLFNALTDMLPILQSENVSCLFFVTAASCSDSPGMLWYEELYMLMKSKPLTGTATELPTEEGKHFSSSERFPDQWWTKVRQASRLDAPSRAKWMSLVRSQCGSPPGLHSERRWRLLNILELRQLAEAGMSIGAHTTSHPVLSLCAESEARREIQQSKIDLERALGRPVWAFAYPFGNSSTMGQREVRLAQEAGFSCAFLNVERWDAGCSHAFMLARTHVTSDMTLPEFAAHLSGVHTRLQRAVGR